VISDISLSISKQVTGYPEHKSEARIAAMNQQVSKQKLP